MSKVVGPIAAVVLAVAALAMPLSSASAQGVGFSNASIQPQAPVSASEPTGTYFADAQQIAAYLRQRGQAVEIDTDSDGDPRIATSAQGARYNIYFYGCTNGRDCNSITFESGFQLKRNSSLEDLNGWNLRKRYAYAVQRTDKSFALRMDVAMVGGLPEQMFVETARLWDGQLGDFLRHINY